MTLLKSALLIILPLAFSVLGGGLFAQSLQYREQRVAGVTESALRKRYPIEKVQFLEMNGQLSGPFRIVGDLSAPSDQRNATLATATNTAVRFFRETEALLGITNVSTPLKLRSVSNGGAVKDLHKNTHVTFTQVVSEVPVEDSELTAHIDSKGNLFAVTGNLVPISPDLLQATTTNRSQSELSENAIRSAIITDLHNAGFPSVDLARLKLQKLAVAKPPYLVWEADVTLAAGRGRWLYKIDVTTGAILDKRNNLQTLQ